jgi:gliding motility associated protien GldN
MKRSILILALFNFLIATNVAAQPKARRQQQQKSQQEQLQQQKVQSTQNQGMSLRARLSFPTAVEMPENVVWRRDIYRELKLDDDANAGLYYPVEPIDKQLNLFTYVFKLALNGYIPVYEYRLDGNEVFSDSAKVQMKTVLDNFHIFYEERDGKVRVDNSDIPSAEVKMYYLKESAYFDDANSTFHRKVQAICPVMLREDDFGGEASKYPLFWVRYADLEPFLSRQTLMTSNLNNAATMSMEDYFTLNRYEGKIYKTNNMLGKTLAQICDGDTTKLSAEQKRIEAELKAFEQNIFGDQQKKDSLDSIAKLDPKQLKAAKKSKGSSSSRSTSAKVKSSKPKKSSTPSSGSARMSVRRERH